MAANYQQISTIHQVHRDWLSKLDFYQDELKIFQNELAQVIRRFPRRLSMQEHVDEYRKILLKKLEHIDNYRNTISLQEVGLLDMEARDQSLLTKHKLLEYDLRNFFREMERMKQGFRRFVSRNN